MRTQRETRLLTETGFLVLTTAFLLLAASTPCLAAREKPLPYHAVTPHYYIETDVSDEFADDIGDFMETLYAAYLKVFNNIQPNWAARLRVRILKNREDYIKEVGEEYSWSGGMYRGRNLGILTSLGRGSPAGVKHVLQHEGFHQFFDKFIGPGATWVNEGLATYFGAGIIEGDKIRLGTVHAATIKAVQDAMDKGKALSLKDLVLITGSEWADKMGGKEKPPEYAQAMLLVHFLVHGQDGRYTPMLNKYLMLQKGGVYGEQALVKAFGSDFGLFEKKWKEYILQLKPYEPPSCTRNLQRLAMLLQYASQAAPGSPLEPGQRPGATASIQELHDMAVAGKIQGWNVPFPDGHVVTPADADEIEKWFHCVDMKGKAITYEFEAPGKNAPFPDVVCRHHGKYLIRAHITPRSDGKGFSIEVEPERLTARKK